MNLNFDEPNIVWDLNENPSFAEFLESVRDYLVDDTDGVRGYHSIPLTLLDFKGQSFINNLSELNELIAKYLEIFSDVPFNFVKVDLAVDINENLAAITFITFIFPEYNKAAFKYLYELSDESFTIIDYAFKERAVILEIAPA